ncbi:hypothetical protein [Tardiphaga sp. P9-11]|uniref:hypothetical protein n=1 Tax=Tardiphaga sp. P9-11 TaxID=2024614 RepID=UPI001FEE2732|nr:hypothetical protein [Tardiphaga sp. P9-11]
MALAKFGFGGAAIGRRLADTRVRLYRLIDGIENEKWLSCISELAARSEQYNYKENLCDLLHELSANKKRNLPQSESHNLERKLTHCCKNTLPGNRAAALQARPTVVILASISAVYQ